MTGLDSKLEEAFGLRNNGDGIPDFRNGLKLEGTFLSTAELTALDGVTAGTVTASKAVLVDANKDIGSFRNVDVTKITGSALVVESLGPMTINLNDTAALQLDNAAISGFAGAASTAGTSVYIETQDGGTPVADASGVAGGAFSLKAGDGSAGGAHTSNDPDGGAGGSITLTPGSGGAAGAGGSGVAGAPGKVQMGGLFHFTSSQVIAMNDAAVTLTRVPGTPAGTLLTSNVLRVDAESSGTENLLLPPEADCEGVLLLIVNTGGESIVVQNDAGSTIDTVATAEFGIFFCDGTAWSGMNVA